MSNYKVPIKRGKEIQNRKNRVAWLLEMAYILIKIRTDFYADVRGLCVGAGFRGCPITLPIVSNALSN